MIFYAVFLSFSTVTGHNGVNLCTRQGFKGREKENANALKTGGSRDDFFKQICRLFVFAFHFRRNMRHIPLQFIYAVMARQI